MLDLLKRISLYQSADPEQGTWSEIIADVNKTIIESEKAAELRGNSGGWDLQTAIKEHAFSLELAYHIWQLNKGKRFFDLGAGPGFYTHFLQQRGLTCWGFDIEPIPEIELTDINKLDLSQPTTMIGKADVVLCLEVGEHIEAEFESIVINNISQLAREKIILSWAIPGQGGYGHVNCQPNDYIINEFKTRGWALNTEESNHLRKHCSGCSWFEETIMVFNKK